MEQNRYTYKLPAIKRSRIRTVVFVAIPEKSENTKPPDVATNSTFCLPQVSAKKPQICDVHTTPKYDTDPKIPCSIVVKFKSHRAYGNIKLTAIFSTTVPITAMPVRTISIV